MQPPQIRRPSASPVPADFLDASETISASIEELCGRFPDYECLILVDHHWNEKRFSLGQFWHRAKAIQSSFEAHGMRPGDRVVLILPTGSELICAYFAAMLGGGIPALAAVPSHRVAEATRYRGLIASVLGNAEARLVYCEEDVAAVLRSDEGDHLFGARILRPSDAPDDPACPDTVIVRTDQVATIQYSSGTTGSPKGVMLSHGAMLNYMRLLRSGVGLTPEDVHVNWAPLYHDMGLFGAFLLPLLCGCPTVLIPTMDFLREPTLWLWALHAYDGAVSWAPNFAYSLCTKRVADEEIEGLDLSRWRLAFNASEPVLAETIEGFARRFTPFGYRPEAMTPAWGLAETVMVITAHPASEAPRVEVVDRQIMASEGRASTSAEGLPLVATGKAMAPCELEIRNPATGARLGDRQVGDIWLRSNCLFLGYHGDPKLTEQVVSNGWLRSGDRGYVVDGHLFFVSREKDLIVIGGEKYAPHDVETAVNRVPGVREGCAVAFGLLDPAHGTEVLGVVAETRQQDASARKELARSIRHEVMRATGLGIRHLKLVPPGGVSKTTSGKLARGATRRRYPEVFGDGF